MANQETIAKEQRLVAKTTLEQYRGLCERMDSINMQLDSNDSRLRNMTATYSEMQSVGTASDSMGDTICMIDELQARLLSISKSLADRCDELLGYIEYASSVDPLAGRVLNMLYLAPGKAPDFMEISERLGNYSEAYMKEKHANGLDIIASIMFS